MNNDDQGLMVIAVIICIVSSAFSWSLMARARAASTRGLRLGWLVIIAMIFGGGTWSTHFVAMLADHFNMPVQYDLATTLFSAVIMMSFSALGFGLVLHNSTQIWAVLGGAIVGLGVGVMHYIGVSAIRIAGNLTFDIGYVALSMGSGILLLSAAMTLQKVEFRGRWAAATSSMAGGVIILHLVGMAAMSFRPDNRISMPTAGLSREWLAALVAGAAILGLFATAVAAAFEAWLRASAEQLQADRMRGLVPLH